MKRRINNKSCSKNVEEDEKKEVIGSVSTWAFLSSFLSNFISNSHEE